ncbi:hypothetical protein FZC76_14415 [Sutcliffiella horikoshii]|uniref:Uncharacterized protein n=1 Tax=Sutcliffiella horikoshii TaxID=79883 RepID=A0A5D4SZU6_9BACI|nr:hypothetical protein FZC76_14415 [Sutcliffiella horikoshii]
MLYENLNAFIYGFLFWWAILLVFKRFPGSYKHKNTWKRDISVTFIQSLVLLAAFQIVFYFQNS